MILESYKWNDAYHITNINGSHDYGQK